MTAKNSSRKAFQLPECSGKCKSKKDAARLISIVASAGNDDHTLIRLACGGVCRNPGKVVDEQGRSLLHVAASAGKVAVVDWLLRHKEAILNAKDQESGYTALHRSIYHGQIHVARYLLDEGANPAILDFDGLNPFDHLARDRPFSHTKSVNFIDRYNDDPASNQTEIYVWGTNANFNLGLGHHEQKQQPTIIEQLRKDRVQVAKVALQKFHSAFLTHDGKVFTCGHGPGGRLGHGHDNPLLMPKQVLAFRDVAIKDLALGEDHSLFLASNGGVWSCGTNSYLQLGHPNCSPALYAPQLIKNSGPKAEKYPPAIGVAAAKYHSAFWTKETLYTWGLNGGQLGHAKGESVATPRIVTALLQKDITFSHVCCAGGATVILTSSGEVIALYDYANKRRLTTKKHHDIVKIEAIGGHLDNSRVPGQDLESRFNDRGGSNLMIFLLVRNGTVHVWNEARSGSGFVQCIFNVSREILVSDFALNRNSVLITCSDGMGYELEHQPRKSSQSSKDDAKPKVSNTFKTFDKSQCDVLKIKQRLVGIYRAMKVFCDPKGRNFCVLQGSAYLGMRAEPQVSPPTAKKDFQNLYDGSPEFEQFQDLKITARDVEHKRDFAASAFIVASASPQLASSIKPMETKSNFDDQYVYELEITDVHPSVLENCLEYMYCGDCQALKSGPRAFILNGPSNITMNSQEEQNGTIYETKPSKGKGSQTGKKSKKTSDYDLVRNAALKLGMTKLTEEFKKMGEKQTRMEKNGDLGYDFLGDDSLKTFNPKFSRKKFSHFSDIILMSEEGEEFSAHQCVLASRLDYFRSMLCYGWVESGKHRTLKLPFPAKALSVLLDFIYLDEMPKDLSSSDDPELVCQVLVLADHVLAQRLVEMCEKKIAGMLTLRSVAELLQFSYDFGAKQLCQAAMSFACHNLAALLELKGLALISDECCQELSKFYADNFCRISQRRLTPLYDSPTSSDLKEFADDAGVTMEDINDYEIEMASIKNTSAATGSASKKTPRNRTKSQDESFGSVESLSDRRERKNSNGSISSFGSDLDNDYLQNFNEGLRLHDKSGEGQINNDFKQSSKPKEPSKSSFSLLKLPSKIEKEVQKNPVLKAPVKVDEISAPSVNGSFTVLTKTKSPDFPDFPDLGSSMQASTPRSSSSIAKRDQPQVKSSRQRKASWKQLSFNDPAPQTEQQPKWSGWGNVASPKSKDSLSEIMKAEAVDRISDSKTSSSSVQGGAKPKKKAWRTLDLSDPNSNDSKAINMAITNPWAKIPSAVIPEVVPESKETNVNGTFRDILHEEVEKKVNLDKAQMKSITSTQLEEQAIEELLVFYNVNKTFDENIRVERHTAKELATPIWNPRR